MKRITPDEVVAALKKHGLKAGRGKYFDRNLGLACGMGILCIDHNPKLLGPGTYGLSDALAHVETNRKLPHDYSGGFTCGFDNRMPSDQERVGPDWEQGYQDGLAAAKAAGLE